MVYILVLVDYRGRRNIHGVYASESLAERYRDIDIEWHKKYSHEGYDKNDYDIIAKSVIDYMHRCQVCNNESREFDFCEFCEKMLCDDCCKGCDFGHVCEKCLEKVKDGRIDENGVEH